MTADDLIYRYVEDRLSLSAVELNALIALLKAEPARAAVVREQMLLDDLLAQKLAVDRRNFQAQVGQRIADFERGQQELDEQVSELRQLAEAEIERPQTWSGNSPWVKYVLALAAAALFAGLFFAMQWLPRQPQLVAKVTAITGRVTIDDGGESSAAALNASLLSGQQIVVPAGGAIEIAYQDATTVRLGGDSAVTLEIDRATGGKQVAIARGELHADIQPQTAGAMIFSTPHAVATVRGTKLRLLVDDTQTLLDVTQGQVQFDRLGSGLSKLVSANESGVASSDELRVTSLEWPQRREGLAYLFSPLEQTEEDGLPLMAARNPVSGNLRKTVLVPQGSARLLEGSLHWELDGGYLITEEAALPDLLAAFAGGELTLEIALTPADRPQTSACIVALADGESANFSLRQEGRGLAFSLRTASAVNEPLRFPLFGEGEPLSRPRHIAITYRAGELIAYVGGAEIARSNDVHGPLAGWREGPLTVGGRATGESVWRGQVAALALYSRRLSPEEIERSAASHRLLTE